MNLITKQLLPVLAIVLVACLIAPQYVSAATEVEHTVVINAPSENADLYDEVVNVANESARKNLETWNPTPTGVWIGGHTEESLFQLNQVTTNNSHLTIWWEAKFSASQIMSGASEMTIRLPIYSDPSAINWVDFMIIRESELGDWTIDRTFNPYTPNTAFQVGPYYSNYAQTVFQSMLMDPVRNDPTSSYNHYTVDGRMYVSVTAPIYSGESYLFIVDVNYKSNGRFALYLSPNDVAADGVANLHFAASLITAPDTATVMVQNYTMDPGVSYDFKNGLAGGIFGKSIYMYAGNTLRFITYAQWAGNTTAYHSVMIPFRTDSGKANVSVRAWIYPGTGSKTILNTSVYTGYILACCNPAITTTTATYWKNFVVVEVEAKEDMRITWFMYDNGWRGSESVSDFRSYSGAYRNMTDYMKFQPNNDTLTGGVYPYAIWYFTLFSTYLTTSNYIPTPEPGVYVPPVEGDAEFDHNIANNPWALALSFIFPLYGVGATTYTVANWVAEDPIRIVYFIPLVNSAAVKLWVYNNVFRDIAPGLPDLPSLEEIEAMLRNLIDGAMAGLRAIGEFVRSIGEAIIQAITWLIDAIVEYGSILLAILCFAAVCVLSFFIIWAQIKLWSMGLKVAKGDLEGAASEGQQIVNTVSTAASTVGKIGGKII